MVARSLLVLSATAADSAFDLSDARRLRGRATDRVEELAFRFALFLESPASVSSYAPCSAGEWLLLEALRLCGTCERVACNLAFKRIRGLVDIGDDEAGEDGDEYEDGDEEYEDGEGEDEGEEYEDEDAEDEGEEYDDDGEEDSEERARGRKQEKRDRE